MANSDDLRTSTLKITTVDIDAVRKAGKLQLARAEAIEAYARFENCLSILFEFLLGAPSPKSSVVFYKITNANNRNKIIESLITIEHGDKYKVYWHGEGKPGSKSGLFKLIYQLDQTRNEIIHWTVARTIATTELNPQIEKLIPPTMFGFQNVGKTISIAELNNFIAKANFVSGSVLSFAINTAKGVQVPDSARDPWLPIFHQPATYPPPSGHPLAPTPKAPEAPPPAS
jgi:hypothetical protein